MDAQERFRGCLLGLACGDALGTTLEFKPRGSFEPITDMVGGGPFGLAPGLWTDDTSMALCLAASLVERGGFDAMDQMERYCRWRKDGYMSSTGTCFDIGNTISAALDSYVRTGEPLSGSTHPRSAGNGCIMRLAPVPMFFHEDLAKAIHHSGWSSRTTHGAAECVAASRLFGAMLVLALRGHSREEILDAQAHLDDTQEPLPEKIRAIADHQYASKTHADIKGSGYVVEALEAALWCFLQTSSYKEAVLMAANLGDDADTTAAICGQIAGAHYGVQSIPNTWLDHIAMRDLMETLADQLRAPTAPVV